MTMAVRNRSIKKTLEAAFGRGKVTVRGSRGTAYGYVDVQIDWTPLDSDQAGEMRNQCMALLRAAKIDLGRRYTDDTCQYETTECSLRFNPSRYYRTMKHLDGTMSVLDDLWAGEWRVAA